MLALCLFLHVFHCQCPLSPQQWVFLWIIFNIINPWVNFSLSILTVCVCVHVWMRMCALTADLHTLDPRYTWSTDLFFQCCKSLLIKTDELISTLVNNWFVWAKVVQNLKTFCQPHLRSNRLVCGLPGMLMIPQRSPGGSRSQHFCCHTHSEIKEYRQVYRENGSHNIHWLNKRMWAP